ncbi:hypothetical protein GCM10023068_28040 [Leifsonia shinshuensis]|uniref:hypothetical protein n=1 Tax=Leifsonia shinshuensis TaxID=150026 RepID=UPI003384BCA9
MNVLEYDWPLKYEALEIVAIELSLESCACTEMTQLLASAQTVPMYPFAEAVTVASK